MNEQILAMYRSYVAVADERGTNDRWIHAVRGCVSAADNGWSPSDQQWNRVERALMRLLLPLPLSGNLALEPLAALLSGMAAFASTFISARIMPSGLPMVLTTLAIGIVVFIAVRVVGKRYVAAQDRRRILTAEQVLIDEVPSYSPFPTPVAVRSDRDFRDHGPDIERIP